MPKKYANHELDIDFIQENKIDLQKHDKASDQEIPIDPERLKRAGDGVFKFIDPIEIFNSGVLSQ